MKKMMSVILFSGIISFIGYGQNLKNDPTYSRSNYKHYNKAVEAERVEFLNNRLNQGTLSTGEIDQNYKAHNNQTEKSTIIFVTDFYRNGAAMTRNYKQQFKPTGENN